MAEGKQVSEPRTTSYATYGEPGLLARIVAIIGFILVVIIVIWGLIHLTSLLSPWFSSRFASTAKPVATLQVHAPASVTSGDAFAISWSYDTSAKGVYAFAYPCSDTLHFETAGTATTTNSIPCGAAFTVSGTSLAVTPTLSGSATTSVPLTILFTPTSGTRLQASTNVIVYPATAVTPVIKKPITQHTTGSGTTPVGPSDLAVTMLSAVVDQNGFATVSFDIANNGAASSGAYSFQATLPTRSGYTYYSPIQSSLAPGSHIVSTLRFTQAIPGAVSVIVDPGSAVNDVNRANNYAGMNMSAPYGYNQQVQYNVQPAYVY